MKKLSVFILLFFTSLVLAQQQDGDLDLTFNPGSGADYDVFKTIVLEDGRILIGGMFGEYNGVERFGLARILPDGSLDMDFNPKFNYEEQGSNGIIRNIAVQDDGKIIAVGEFTHCNGEERSAIARLHSDGTLDEDFNPVFTAVDIFGDTLSAYYHIGIEIVEEGKILVHGDFDKCNGVERKGIARLNSDGTLDETFHFPQGLAPIGDRKTNNFAVQSDGKILIAGKEEMMIYNGDTIKGIIRLNPDGSLDGSFRENITSASFHNLRIYAISSLPNDDVLIAGVSNFSGFFFKKLKKENGQIDTDFSSLGYDSDTIYDAIYSIKQAKDGKIVLGRDGSVVRIFPDGSLDTTFNNENEISDRVYDLTFQEDGKIIIGGSFLEINSVSRPGLARLYGKDTTSALTENLLSDYTIYPNPAKDIVVVNNVSPSSTIAIYDMTGKVRKQVLADSEAVKMNVSSLENGIYIIHVIKNTTQSISKLVINR